MSVMDPPMMTLPMKQWNELAADVMQLRDIAVKQRAEIDCLTLELRDGTAAWKANRETLAQAARGVIAAWDSCETAAGMIRAIAPLRELV